MRRIQGHSRCLPGLLHPSQPSSNTFLLIVHQKHPNLTVHNHAHCLQSPIHTYQKCSLYMAKTSTRQILSIYSSDRNPRLMWKFAALRRSGAFLRIPKLSNADQLYSSVQMVLCSLRMSCIPEHENLSFHTAISAFYVILRFSSPFFKNLHVAGFVQCIFLFCSHVHLFQPLYFIDKPF